MHRQHDHVVADAQIVEMRDAVQHRGPDDAGYYVGDGIALGVRRLAIVDLSPNGHMPMRTPDGRYTIVYNGEIYNYRELRPLLEAKGYAFHSNTDTEVLLNLYAEEGPSMLSRLIGMFAFAIWDAVDRRLFIARDRLGVKPLVYTEQNNALYFASEEKCFSAAGLTLEFDPECWDELLYFRYISGENTVYRNVKNLLPGHYLIWQEGSISIHRYWHLGERLQALRGTIRDPVAWYQETFASAVNYRLISDVPVGVLLSGGLDSSSVAIALGQLSQQLAAFTVRFEDTFHDEGDLAREVAQQNGLRFHELYVSSSADLPKLVQEATWYQDAPLVHGNDAHMLAISRYAKPHVTVLLSGEGGDETLGGYVRYRPLSQPPALLSLMRVVLPLIDPFLGQQASLFKRRLHKLQRFLGQGSMDDFILYNSCEVLPTDLQRLGVRRDTPSLDYRRKMLREAKALFPKQAMRQAMYLDQHTFLQSLLARNDRMTMGASIECRVPFLDHRLVEGVASLDTSALINPYKSKNLLRKAYGKQLPSSILKHRKVGFSVPWDTYMRDPHGFAPVLEDMTHARSLEAGPLPISLIRSLVQSFQAGNDQHLLLLRQLMFVHLWQQCLDQATVPTMRTN